MKPSYKRDDKSRDGLMKNPVFVDAFTQAKERIRNMNLRFVEEKDQTKQVLLEIYCAVALRAPYNDFNTH